MDSSTSAWGKSFDGWGESSEQGKGEWGNSHSHSTKSGKSLPKCTFSRVAKIAVFARNWPAFKLLLVFLQWVEGLTHCTNYACFEIFYFTKFTLYKC